MLLTFKSLWEEKSPGSGAQVNLASVPNALHIGNISCQSTHQSCSINKRWLCPSAFSSTSLSGRGVSGGGGVVGGLSHRIDPGRKSLCFPWLSNGDFFLNRANGWKNKGYECPRMFHNQTSYLQHTCTNRSLLKERPTCTQQRAPQRFVEAGRTRSGPTNPGLHIKLKFPHRAKTKNCLKAAALAHLDKGKVLAETAGVVWLKMLM